MTIAFQSERHRGLFVLQLARAEGVWGEGRPKKRGERNVAFFLFFQNTVNRRGALLAERQHTTTRAARRPNFVCVCVLREQRKRDKVFFQIVNNHHNKREAPRALSTPPPLSLSLTRQVLGARPGPPTDRGGAAAAPLLRVGPPARGPGHPRGVCGRGACARGHVGKGSSW